MKLNYKNILLAFSLSLLPAVFTAAHAQDAQFPTIEDLNDDPSFHEKSIALNTWNENEPKSNASKSPKDSASVATKPKQLKAPDTNKNVSKIDKSDGDNNTRQEKKEDDSVLSFNFLYYIFQKYKLQDIVD